MKLSGEVLITEKQIRKRISEIATRINSDYKNEDIIILAVLNGAYIFSADITRKLTIRHSLGFVGLKSTQADKTGQIRECRFFTDEDFTGKNVLLLDDIYDSGGTLTFLKKQVEELNANEIKTCLLVRKEHNRKRKHLDIDYLGFSLPDKWIVGYGMDFNGQYRSLPYIGYVEKEKS
jgi:hypoxanthine phosphoribosyltransferase